MRKEDVILLTYFWGHFGVYADVKNQHVGALAMSKINSSNIGHNSFVRTSYGYFFSVKLNSFHHPRF